MRKDEDVYFNTLILNISRRSCIVFALTKYPRIEGLGAIMSLEGVLVHRGGGERAHGEI